MIRGRGLHFPAGRDFALARLGGVRSGLLGPAGPGALLALPGAPERLAALRESIWAPAASAATPAEAEIAAADGARETGARLLLDLGARDRRLVRAFLLPDDVRAVRGALRAVAHALPADRAARLLEPTPALDRRALQAIAASADAAGGADVLAALGSPLAPALRVGGSDVRRPGALLAVELALDESAARAVAAACRGPGADRRDLRTLTAARADLSAAAEILALAGDPARDGFPVQGGTRLPAAEARRIAALPREEIPAALSARLADLLGDPALAASRLGRVATADHLLGGALSRLAHRMARAAPLGIALPCGILAELSEELRRVRLVLRATADGFPSALLVDLLEA